MKTKLLLFFVIFSQFAIAQEVNCAEKENQLSAFLSNNEFKKVATAWDELKVSCPSYNENIYLLGNKVLQYNIELAAPENKEKEVRELLKLYNQYDKNFPNNQNGNFEKRAMALYDNKAGTKEEITDYLDQAFNKQKNTFTNPQAIFIYFEIYFKKYESDKKSISTENLLDKYYAINALIETNTEKLPAKAAEYSRVVMGLDSYMNPILVCDNLIPYAQKNFENNKSDYSWLASTAKALSVKCKTAPIFETIALELHKLKPSSKSAYYLAIYNINTGKLDTAINFFTESVSLATNNEEKASTAYTVASILANSDKAKANDMAAIAIQNNPSNGTYFIFLANLYANSIEECATNEIEKKAIYKLASDTVLKAAQIEPRLKSASESRSKEYLKNVVFEKKNKVKQVKLGCWINQTVHF